MNALALFAGRQCALTHSARVAIRAACDVLGLKPGDEILVPAYNCGSEVDPLLHAGLVPVLYPVSGSATVDPSEIAALITPRCRALYLIPYFGFPHANAGTLRELCDQHGLALIEDCALSLLSDQVGRTGEVAVYNFSKFFPVHAGGALVLNRPGLVMPGFGKPPPVRPAIKFAVRAAVSLLLGKRGKAVLKSLRGKRPALEPVARPDMPLDYYFDPTLIATRLGTLATGILRRVDVDAAIAQRRHNFRVYQRLLAGIPGVTPLYSSLPDGVCPLNMPVLVEDRDRIAASMTSQGIAVVPWWAGYHKGLDFTGFPQARHLKGHILALPLHQGMTEADLKAVASSLLAAIPGA
jgi:perosamine synthetase